MFEGPVEGPLGVFRKTAAGKLALFDVVFDALAADPLAGTGIVGAGTACKVPFLFAVNGILRTGRGFDFEARTS
jgi:hypothetical protein